MATDQLLVNTAESGDAVEYGGIRAGNATHTGRMLGYCPQCGLYHSGRAAEASCARLLAAANESDEMVAWRALKVAVAMELDTNWTFESLESMYALVVAEIPLGNFR
jgi:hypothetical protein